MRVATKLGVYGLVLTAALAGGAAVGAATGPIDVGDSATHEVHDTVAALDATSVGGLAVAEAGYRITTDDRVVNDGFFTFAIEGPDGAIVTAFDVEHEKRLHLVIASRDLEHYAHLHPTMAGSGQWSAELPVLAPGAYRAIADFHPTGAESVALGVDLVSPGPVARPQPLTQQVTDRVDDYDVRLEVDSIEPGAAGIVTLTVTRDGETVTTDPYLGARGHLVALRDGDLAYLHVHPLPATAEGSVRFAVEAPSAGTYALFFDFSHNGAVRTARFVVDTAQATAAGDPLAGDNGSDHVGDHAVHSPD